MSRFDEQFLDDPEDDPYVELFADCETVEQMLELQKEIDEAEASGR